MKRNLIFIICIFLFNFSSKSQIQRTCGTMNVFNTQINSDSVFQLNQHNLEQNTEFLSNNLNSMSITNSEFKIPVVVHILYFNYNSPEYSISDEQVYSQIEVLNNDFNALNSDISNVPSYFQNLIGTTNIEFVLAEKDPSGQYMVSGINRVQTDYIGFYGESMKYSELGGVDAWDTERYLNIWVCNIAEDILGFAQFPGGDPTTDGVVIDYECFGTFGTATYPFNKGRTLTHEVGHWLNLRHIWGDELCGDDLVEDTPTQEDAHFGCPLYQEFSCGNYPNGDMYMNFMDYVDDECMHMFTEGQKNRMIATLIYERDEIINTSGCVDVNAFNFNPESVLDDGTCCYISGCTDENANNYDSDACFDDGSCTYDIEGCTDPLATNYNPDATINDECCNYLTDYYDLELINVSREIKCGYHYPYNLNPDIYIDTLPLIDFSYTIKNNGTACVSGGQSWFITYPIYVPSNYSNSEVLAHWSFTNLTSFPPGEYKTQTRRIANLNGIPTFNDSIYIRPPYESEIIDLNTFNDYIVLEPLSTSDFPDCSNPVYFGCTDQLACNYDIDATEEDGSCEYLDGICESCVEGVIIDNDLDNDGICDEDEIAGCTDQLACNYDIDASDDDGSCYYITATISQNGDSLISNVNIESSIVDWYNVQSINDTVRYWLMAQNTSYFNPSFDCSYFIIASDVNCSVTSPIYYYSSEAKSIGSLFTSPNPTDGFVNVSFENNKNQFVKLYLSNNNGHILDEFITTNKEINIDLSSYPSGTYHISFNSPDSKDCLNENTFEKIANTIILR